MHFAFDLDVTLFLLFMRHFKYCLFIIKCNQSIQTHTKLLVILVLFNDYVKFRMLNKASILSLIEKACVIL